MLSRRFQGATRPPDAVGFHAPTACSTAAQRAATCLGQVGRNVRCLLVERTPGAVYKAQILADARLRFALQRVYYVGSTAQGARDGLSQFVERRGFGQQFFNASRRAQRDLVREDTCGQRDDGQIAC